MREALDVLVTELRRLKLEGVSRVSVDTASLEALRSALSAARAEAGEPAAPAAVPGVSAAPEPVRARPEPAPVSAPVASAPARIESAPRPAPAPAKPLVAPAERTFAVPPPPPVPSLSGDVGARLAALEKLLAGDRVTASGLASGRIPVSGDGAVEAPVLFLIHMPGADDGFAGRVLTGAEGDLYGKIVAAMGLSRDRVHTAAVVPYRPEVAGGAHREPHRDEYAYFLPYLRARIATVNPRVIVALGGGALEAMCGPGDAISKTRGVWREFDGIPVMPTYHISYLIRNNTNKSKRIVWEDLLAVMERLALPISAKQRGYFAEKA